MWQVFQTAKTFNCRPSELLDIDDPWTAYCLDSSIASYCNAAQNAVDSVEGKTDKETNRKRQRELDKWLGVPARYRNPMGPMKS